MATIEQPGIRYWSMIEPAWIPLNESWDGGPRKFEKTVRRYPAKVVHLYAAHWCQSEVCNGGLIQFFTNTTGLMAPETLAGFHAIGIKEWEDVVREGMQVFGKPYPRERAVREELIDRSKAHEGMRLFDALDKKFFAWLNAMPDRWEKAADHYANET